jgi:sugar O-acyltransferase (sialic acid O-acetyltransferase NeuD family)
MKLAVVGARADGGAHMLLDLVADGAPFEVIAFLDDDPALWRTEVAGIPVLGPSTEAARAVELGAEGAVVFLSRPVDRERAATTVLDAGLELPVVIHPRAYVAPSAVLGRGTFVGAMAVVSTGAKLAELVMVAPTAFVSHHVEIGALAQLSPGCRLGGRSRLGRRVFVGLGATIVSERNVGDDAIVGAGAVVLADVAANTTVAGVPARPHATVKPPPRDQPPK